jgi:hypothetical protein
MKGAMDNSHGITPKSPEGDFELKLRIVNFQKNDIEL